MRQPNFARLREPPGFGVAMLRFRSVRPGESAVGPLPDLLAIGQMIDEALRPGQFFIAPPLHLTWETPRTEHIPWEIFRGHLLESAQTRASRTFLAWHIRLAAEPLLSVLLDVEKREIHVTRGFLCQVWEGYDSEDGAILSREVPRWKRELVGTLPLGCSALEPLRDELICLLWQAVVGTSRLPLTSLEAPLPAFTLGHFAYVYRAGADEDALREPLQSYGALLEQGWQPDLAERERVKLLEACLRSIAPAEAPALALRLSHLLKNTADMPRLLRSLFNAVSLSPYTQFVDSTLACLDALVQLGALSEAAHADFLGHLLRQLGRHLAAYDLVTFHQRGANYPDALLLDAVLKRQLLSIEARPELFSADTLAAQRRRAALRQGCLARRQYEGHLVPDMPTSPGENARVYPGHPQVPEEQLAQPLRRRRQLFGDEPLAALLGSQARHVLQQSCADLAHPAEQLELGLALFIDRPLGYAKLPGEQDQTPLLAHQAYSPSLAERCLEALAKLCGELDFNLPKLMPRAAVSGLPHARLAAPVRPSAALADVRRVADDFVIVRTLSEGLADLWRIFDFGPLRARFRLPFLAAARPRLVAQIAKEDGTSSLTFFDDELRPRLELTLDLGKGYAHRAGFEFPAAGLHVRAVAEEGEPLRDVAAADVRVSCAAAPQEPRTQ
jgi:hypothetical protein